MATQRRKSSIQKRRSSMKRKYMKNRKVKGGLFGFFGKKAGESEPEPEVKPEPEDPASTGEEEEGVIGKVGSTLTDVMGNVGDAVGSVTGSDEKPAEEASVKVPEGVEVGGKKKKRKGTKKKKGSKKRKTAKKTKKSKKKKGKK